MSEEIAVYNAGAIAPANNVKLATDVAGLCKAIVTATAQNIQGRKYVRVEGWQAIATAHGCVASARDVEVIEGGIRAIGEVRRMDTGSVICTAEGFLGTDEEMWQKRPLYARRAMCQTRAISRACRSAFAHVVVMMNAGLETTPAEEVPHDGFADAKPVGGADNTTPPAHPKPAPTSTPPADLPAALASLGDGETKQIEVRFDAVQPPPAGKKAKRVTLSGREYPTMHEYESCQPGDKLLVTFRASLFNNKMHIWADDHQNLQAEELPMGAAPGSNEAMEDQAGRASDMAAKLLPPGVKEFWPETEFDQSTEVIVASVAGVIEPVLGKSGKHGPHKVSIKRDDGTQFVVDTFDSTLAAVAKSYVGTVLHEVAFVTSVSGKFTNRRLVGCR